jgi:hypothetical protein
MDFALDELGFDLTHAVASFEFDIARQL